MLVKDLPTITIGELESYMAAPDDKTRGDILGTPTADALVIFAGADWCRPCGRTQGDLPAEMADPGEIAQRQCDANRDEFVVGQCSIRSFPSAAVFISGKFKQVIKLDAEILAGLLSKRNVLDLVMYCDAVAN